MSNVFFESEVKSPRMIDPNTELLIFALSRGATRNYLGV